MPSTTRPSRSASASPRGYYLYRHRFQFDADGIRFGEPALPRQAKKDDAFGEVEDLPQGSGVHLPSPPATLPFALALTSQGCADIGICYPPRPHRRCGFGQRRCGSGASGPPPAAAATAQRRRSTTNPGGLRLLDSSGATVIPASFFFGFAGADTPACSR